MLSTVRKWSGRLIALIVGVGAIIVALLGISRGDYEVALGLFFGPIFVIYGVGGNAAFQKLGRFRRFGEPWK